MLLVSAAADLIPVFRELGPRFEAQTGVAIRFNFGSSGQLAQQIEHGAPVDVFAAANVALVNDLEQKGLLLPGTRQVYARGRLTLWTRAESPLRLEGLADLAQPEVRRVGIAHPEHAPYGAAARQALQAAGLWEAVQPRLVIGENVNQVLQYAAAGNVDAALLPLSLSLSSAGRWVLLPESLHAPLDQALAAIRRTRHPEAARQFVAFMTGPQGQQVLAAYGFTFPSAEGRP